MIRLLPLLIYLTLSWISMTQSGLAAVHWPTDSTDIRLRIMRHQPIPMRDGIRLFGDIYLPEKPGRYPTIVVRTCYGVQRENINLHQDMFTFARHGYAVVMVDTRGRYESEGKWTPFRDEGKDGYDVIEWAARQHFSNGKVGTQGGSYLGHNQWRAMSERPPHLKAAFPLVASTNIYANWLTMGGAFRLSFNYGWGVVRMPDRIMLPQSWHTEPWGPANLRYDTLLRHLPLKDGDLRSAGYAVPHYREWLAHESYDAYWKAISDEENFQRFDIPVHTFGGWFDIFVQGTINGYVGMRNKAATPEARAAARMIIGPWGHGASTSFGELKFTDDAMISHVEREIRFFDHHLKGIRNGIEAEDPVRLYYMGVNKWRSEKDWPVPGTVYRALYLDGAGKANTLSGDGRLAFNKPNTSAKDQYRYDPLDPVPTLGGNNCCGTPTLAGPRDQRPIETRQDILVYNSDELTEDLTIAGPVKMKLFAATDGPDTDWMIKLIDVFPDGRSMPVSEGILRARFRQGLDKIRLLNPGETYEYDIEMTGTANVFQKGHRIRVDITSSNFPQFDRNPNTGAPLGSSAKTRVAVQTIHHGGDRVSAIILPVVPAIQ
jgi:putative CocE/NonD family hydrolase